MAITTATSGLLSFRDLPVYFKFITNAVYYPELSSQLLTVFTTVQSGPLRRSDVRKFLGVIKEISDRALHKRVFTVAVCLDGRELGVASGKRKKEAEALAAKEALEKLQE